MWILLLPKNLFGLAGCCHPSVIIKFDLDKDDWFPALISALALGDLTEHYTIEIL